MIPGHVYVHAPFCARRCSYCDFAVTVDRTPIAEPWLLAIAAELRAHARHEGWNRLPLQTLYVGGGTPSLFGPGAMAGLARGVQEFGRLDETVEWTVEANPEHFDAGLAADWLGAGVNRLSLGAQTFHEPALRWMGRLHGAAGPGRALQSAREAGFRNISLDLIFGLPARLERNLGDDLDRMIDLGPEHISLYGLTAEKGAALGRWVDEGRETMADEDAYADEYLQAAAALTGAGYVHYEVSNFARSGRESRHNAAYWTGAAYLGLGPGAHSFLPPRRSWNVRDWAIYRDRLLGDEAAPGREAPAIANAVGGTNGAGLPGAARGTPLSPAPATGWAHAAVEGGETIDDPTASMEAAWLGLRTRDGVRVTTSGQRALATEWVVRGWASLDDDHLCLTADGWLLLDRLAVELDGASRSIPNVKTTGFSDNR